jgi:hypothetical protein
MRLGILFIRVRPSAHRCVSDYMQESPFGFHYTWTDLQPVRALAITVLVAQVIGAVFGLIFGQQSTWGEQIWCGGAIATFPAFLVGLVIQSRLRPGSIGQNLVMVRRMGLIALLFSIIAVFME